MFYHFVKKIIKSYYLTRYFSVSSIIYLSVNFTIILTSTSVLALSPPQWKLTQLPTKSELRSSAATTKTLWVAGSNNTVYLSVDHGITWNDISPNEDEIHEKNDYRGIAVLNDQTAIVMAAGNGDESKLLITHNQGLNWQVLEKNTDKMGFYDSVSFWNEQEGVLLGDPVDGHFMIKITKDQGKNWQRLKFNNMPKISIDESAFAASGNTIKTGKKDQLWFVTGGNSASIYSSIDKGLSWNKTSLPLYQKTPTAGAYALALNQQKELFVLGGDYLDRAGKYPNITRYHNGQWQQVNSGETGLKTAMACIDDTCIMTGKLSSDISYDRGKSWQHFSAQGFYALASNNFSIVAAGTAGKIAVLQLNKTNH